jgi:hypothetical protein
MKKSGDPFKKRVVINFDHGTTDQRALILLQLGQSDKFVGLETGLTPGQISYRQRKAKANSPYVDMPGSWRTMWRNGNNPLLEIILKDYARIMAKEIELTITPKISHVTPQTVKR